tara:strand:- start:699 stop:989 length:291 start_codon:yes stop_codon:yes gene_type:complete
MITNYNDGDWHPWAGGDCPVHQDSIVDLMMNTGDTGEGLEAGNWNWGNDIKTKIVAFRVTKEYKPEPRDFWITTGHYVRTKKPVHMSDFIHVREVL